MAMSSYDKCTCPYCLILHAYIKTPLCSSDLYIGLTKWQKAEPKIEAEELDMGDISSQKLRIYFSTFNCHCLYTSENSKSPRLPNVEPLWTIGHPREMARSETSSDDGAKRPSGGKVWEGGGGEGGGVPAPTIGTFLYFQHVKVAFSCTF